MQIIKKTIFALVFIVFEISMFKISWELGISSLILISTIFCIFLVLKKITTIVIHNDLALNSEPFRDSEKLKLKNSFESEGEGLESKNLIPGLDGSLFENFKNNLKLNDSIDSSDEDMHTKENFQNRNLLKEAYENSSQTNEPSVFAEELDQKEQVKVTLSKDARKIDEDQEDYFEKEKERSNINISEIPDRDITNPVKKLGTGEEELEILTKKHQALMKQSENLPSSDLVEYEDNLFEDELIPISADEKISKTENASEADKENYYFEDEKNLESSFKNKATLNEKIAEAEALLGLATKTCSSGKIEEAKASLKIYLDLLDDLGQEPSQDVKELATKLEIPLYHSQGKTKSDEIAETKNENNVDDKRILQDLPEQTNYATVMDDLVKSLEEKEAYEEALPLLKDLLNYNRKRNNVSEMDPLYDRIEQAYSSLKNDEELVKTYREHLTIKQQLNDLEGELNLLDLISYYYANTGDQKASNHYQVERKRIKDILDQKITSEKS